MTESEKPKNCECVVCVAHNFYMKKGFLSYYDRLFNHFYEIEVNYCPMCGQKVMRDG